MLTAPKVIRVLALHGKGSCADMFEKSLENLMRSYTIKNSQQVVLKCIDAPFELNGSESLQWWTLPPNTRSFEAKKYEGFEVSAQRVLHEISSSNFDIILGHSQGAILLASLIASHPEEILPACESFILNGVAWPNPYTDKLENFEVSLSKNQDVNMLFVIGSNDSINPPKLATRVANCFRVKNFNVEICDHDGGHSVPVRNEQASQEIIEWMKFAANS